MSNKSRLAFAFLTKSAVLLPIRKKEGRVLAVHVSCRNFASLLANILLRHAESLLHTAKRKASGKPKTTKHESTAPHLPPPLPAPSGVGGRTDATLRELHPTVRTDGGRANEKTWRARKHHAGTRTPGERSGNKHAGTKRKQPLWHQMRRNLARTLHAP